MQRASRSPFLHLKLSLALLAGMLTKQALGFPENIRLGYAGCLSCHVSPTGGGLLTPYGRGASEDFLSTWTRKDEAQVGHGKVAPPKSLLLGGDLRGLAVQRDTRVFKEKAFIPMQLELQTGLILAEKLTAALALGLYDQNVELQNAYGMAQISDLVFVRIGKFFPAYGLYIPNHSVVTRRGLGFNQGQETINFEAGIISESGEIIVDAILKQGLGELSSEDKGATLRGVWYVRKESQIGLSLLSTKGTVWERQAVGVFAASGITRTTYLLGEINRETKKPADSADPSTPENTRLVSMAKVGWEITRGLHIFGAHESSVTTKGTYDPRLSAFGPGIQWFPRPHFEVVGELQSRLDETFSKKPGQKATLLLHYYL